MQISQKDLWISAKNKPIDELVLVRTISAGIRQAVLSEAQPGIQGAETAPQCVKPLDAIFE